MEFEQAIENAQILFLFDRRSQQQLQEMAEEAAPRSRDRYLIRLTQAAFAYYNSADGEPAEVRRIIQQAQTILREVKQYREDRVFYTMALRLEVDLLMHLSALNYQAASRQQKPQRIYNEDDSRALSISETLLKNFPPSFDPLPNAWYSGVVPLFPTYRDEVVLFYKDRVKDNRIIPLQTIMQKIKDELVLVAGVIQAKQFIAENGIVVNRVDRVNKYLVSNVHAIGRFVAQAMPQTVHLASDISLPRGIPPSELDTAVQNVEGQIEQARNDKDIRKFTGHLLQLGILHFLRESPEETVSALVRTLHASSRIGPEDKKIRQYRHEQFPDIPFMIGTSYLRELLPHGQLQEQHAPLLQNCLSGLMQAIALQNGYHQGFVNLLAALHFHSAEEQEGVYKLYLARFGNDLAQLNGLAFRNLAFLEYQANQEKLNPDIVMWMIVSEFCTGGELTKARKMLQELKTLYILNAHDYSVAYLEHYRTAFRIKDEEFIKDLENDELHSAILFHLSHAFTSLSLVQGKYDGELAIEYANLDQGTELNTEALYFHPHNGSALRLLDTQIQILHFALQRSQKRWENINQIMGQRFQLYEDYLRQEKSVNHLQEALVNLKMESKLPELNVSRPVLARMAEVITSEQRDRLKHRVQAT